jgi:hypothetical protein
VLFRGGYLLGALSGLLILRIGSIGFLLLLFLFRLLGTFLSGRIILRNSPSLLALRHFLFLLLRLELFRHFLIGIDGRLLLRRGLGLLGRLGLLVGNFLLRTQLLL